MWCTIAYKMDYILIGSGLSTLFSDTLRYQLKWRRYPLHESLGNKIENTDADRAHVLVLIFVLF